MRCSEIKDYLLDYILEELSPEVQIQVNEHLAICHKCKGEVQQTEALLKGLEDSETFKPAPGIYGRIIRQISVPKPQRARLFGVRRSVVFAFAAFLLGIVMTKAIDVVVMDVREPSRIEVRQEVPRRVPFSDTVEFYSVPAKNLARI